MKPIKTIFFFTGRIVTYALEAVKHTKNKEPKLLLSLSSLGIRGYINIY